MQRFIILMIFLQISLQSVSQIITDSNIDSTSIIKKSKVEIAAYLDFYYGNTINNLNETVQYFVSSNSNNEFNVNLAFVDFKYTSEGIRLKFTPGFGTYMNSNYANEPATLKYILEASLGIRLSRKRDIWLDTGVLGSPYTNENAISRDHLMYTRSLAPEYVPYYLAGLKLSVPISTKVKAYFYLINGWQQIEDVNKKKSIGTQLEYKLNENHLLNWNTYVGSETSPLLPEFKMRYFSDIFWIYNNNGFSSTACIYVGNQIKEDNPMGFTNNFWWQSNIIGRYTFTEKLSLSARFEYFNDKNNIQITSIHGLGSIEIYSAGLCLNVKVNEEALLRFEGRHFFSKNVMFVDKNNIPTDKMTWLVSNMTVWF